MVNRKSCGKWLLAAPVLAGWLAAGAQPANADLLVEYRLDGGALTTLASSPSDSDPLLFGFGNGTPIGGVVDVNGVAQSNSPGLPTLAQLLSTTLNITNLDTVSHTLELFITAQNFSSPVPPPGLLLDSQINGAASAAVTSGNSLSATSCVDTTNGAHACATPSTTAGPGTPSLAGGTFDSDVSAFIGSLTAPYSMGQDLVVTLEASGEVSYAWTTTVAVAAVPEPATLAVIGCGLLGLGATRVRRRTR